jgi:phosphatidate cytidylyltransferase
MKNNNLLLRTITGICFVIVLVSSIILSLYSYAIIFSIVTALSVAEFCEVINVREKTYVNKFINIIAGVYLYFAFFGFCWGISGSQIFIPYLILLIYMLISELYAKRPDPIVDWAYSILAQVYVALPISLLHVIALQANQSTGEITYQPMLILSIFIFLWLNDTGAYCIGSLLGKHRLFARISPKKSWEGSIGGGIFVIIASLVIAHFCKELTPLKWCGLGLVVIIFGTWGDLVESLLKRTLGIKDSGNILPGHGGMLDRFDSLLLAVPAAVVYLYTISLW